AGGGPHIGHVNILIPVVIEIEPGGAHTGPGVLDSRSRRDSGEGSVAVVAIEVTASKVVGHAEVRRSVSIEIAPGASETVAIVLNIQPRSLSSIGEVGVAVVVQQKVRRPVARVKVGDGIVILVQTHVIAVETEINVETPVAIVIGDSGVGESSLRRSCKLERIGLKREVSTSLVKEQQRAAAANHQKILDSLIFEIGKQGAGCVIKDSHSGLFGHILKGSIAAVTIEAVRESCR